ncbi:transcriptional regulator [Sulfurimonas aquatica]|uniref:Transcriptional regulator n=1 Tax=Sulfurimonas aquatica TaxID=2672570 RepID=A0A975AYS9_9BACT|nr:helix-turn-helix domain-containing protein [Sulfurimonas aquatica]QSZ41086.1 transcriptional regulator [Sulfurimonas aquatica]
MSKITCKGKEYNCAFEYTLELISGKWKGLVLWHLQDKTLRYGEIKKVLGNITQKMLTQTLRTLEEDQLITRKVYPVVPPKVEYTITDRGLKLIPIFEQLIEWGSDVATLEGAEFQ